ncbi:class I SAM-dependent methyltransferase [candidate division KSB1 bacterium]|nr:class I SAM-dependent methyltransferase [candidate division KSB1 bacterium]
MKFFGTKDIKVFVERALLKRTELNGKIVIDIPAGSGHSTRILQRMGAKVESYDLFPEFFNVGDITCNKVDLSRKQPKQSQYADYVLCQEGIEHVSDQLFMLQELNRILKKGGILFLTTPNHSKLRSKFSYLLSESEYSYKIMPPNEMDSIWFSDNKVSDNIYFGHIFLIGIQKLRVLARLAGFRIKKIHHLRVNRTSFFLLLLFYPLIFFVNLFAYIRAINSKKGINRKEKTGVYGEILKLGIDPRILFDGHLFVEFEKEFELDQVQSILFGKYKDFNIVT